MKKKQIANLIMIAVILVIALFGALGVGYIRGWFDTNDGTSAVLAACRGVVLLEREGVSCPAESGTVLRTGDKLSCNPGAAFTLQTERGELTFSNNASLQVQDAAAEDLKLEIHNGEVFVNTRSSVSFAFKGEAAEIYNAVALLSVRTGAQSLSVFSGAVGQAQMGQALNWVNGEMTVGELTVAALNDFAISQLRKANETTITCFTKEDLDRLEADRLAEAETVPTAPAPTQPDTAKPTEPQPTQPAYDGYCTITIRCDTILDNWDDLDPSKAGYVPSSGVILKTTKVGFNKGETVFDVLKRICKKKGIQLEYSWTPMYDSYYIEGIHHLYEFDCGSESGWMYKVNGWFPNYGCSAYELQGDEKIVWSYTCKGLGTDVGASRMNG